MPGMPKFNRNLIIGIGVAVVLIFVGIIGWAFLQKAKLHREVPPAGKTMEEVLKSLTAPESQEGVKVPEEVLKSLTAPR